MFVIIYIICWMKKTLGCLNRKEFYEKYKHKYYGSCKTDRTWCQLCKTIQGK